MKSILFTSHYKIAISPLLLLLFLFGIWSCNSDSSVEYLFKEVNKNHSNIKFRNVIPEDKLTNSFFYEYVYNGGGVALGDLNNDGLTDIYFTSNLHKNALYLNEGNLKFVDITIETDMQGQSGWTTGVNMVDINGDGYLDIYICKSGPYETKKLLQNELYINLGPDKNGKPQFKESAVQYGLDAATYSIQSAFLDFDLDGDLDMYLMNHNPQTFAIGDSKSISPFGDKFYVNDNGKFIDRTEQVGILSSAVAYGLGVGVGDLNNDGWPDIYISNDYDEPDYMYLNLQNGTFKEVIKQSTKHISNFAMGNDIADIDNDGYTDILTLDMVSEDNYGMKTSMASMNPQKFQNNVDAGKHFQYMYNTLQKHTTYIDSAGVPYFSEIGQIAGVSNTDWSWAPLIADFDNDGLKDIFISNGIKRDFRNKDFFNYLQEYKRTNGDALTNPDKINALVAKSPYRPSVNYFYKNSDGINFENKSQSWIKDPKPTYSNGAAYADLDNDGDLDLIINNVDEPASILENLSNLRNNNYLRINLEGPQKNHFGIGSKVEIYTTNGIQLFENYAVRGFQSSVQPGIHIGLGNQSHVDSVRVIWPDNMLQVIVKPEINTIHTIKYIESNTRPYYLTDKTELLFTQLPRQVDLVHQENDFDDYLKQLLLPHKMSQYGPAIAVGDINGDGREDLYLGQSTGYISKLYLQTKNGSFKESQAFDDDKNYEDVDAVFLDIDNDGDLDLYVASGGNEFEVNHALYQDRLYENINGQLVHRPSRLPTLIPISSSRIQVYDYDGDGYLDIFVGGRHVPHDYPAPASSHLLHNDKGTFSEVSSTVAPDLQGIGLVTDASWLDYDSDGDTDLIVVGEWMSPIILNNTDSKFERIIIDSFNLLSGWYYTVRATDIDNDGDQDILLGNLGENYKYKATQDEPFEIYYHDFDGNQSKDLVLGYYNFGEAYPVRGRECSSQQIPDIKKRMPTYHDFGSSTLSDIYGPKELKEALHLSVVNFKSGILKNNGNSRFEFIPFPEMAQLSSINTILIRDLNNDNLDEIILSGNLFSSEIETPRNDAGYGLVLQNEGNGKFTTINAAQSGLFLPGDVKTMNFIKINNKMCLISGNNNGAVSFQKMK